MNILIIGGTSLIAQHIAYLYALENHNLILTSRNFEKINNVVSDLIIRTNNKNIFPYEFNPINYEHHNILIEFVKNNFTLDLIIISYGQLSSNDKVNFDYNKFYSELNINFLSVCSIVFKFIEYFTEIKKGKIAVITSVAGIRPRYSNYIYGIGKGSLSLFLQGLRTQLYDKNIYIIDIKPGLVDTPMTSHLKKNFLFAKPQKIAKDIISGITKGNDIIYTPFFWQFILFLVKIIPEKIFKKLKF